MREEFHNSAMNPSLQEYESSLTLNDKFTNEIEE